MLARADDAELVVERVEESLGHPFPDAHRPVALHVGVPAHRAHPGAGLANHAAQQQKVGEFGDRGHRVGVLRDAHRPAHDRPL